MEPTVLVAIVAAAVVAGLVISRMHRTAREHRPDPTEPPPASLAAGERAPIRAADQRFRLLSFQGGSVPSDLGPVLEELRHNGIEVDEETVRRKLAEQAAEQEAPAGEATAAALGTSGSATVVEVADAPAGDAPVPPGRVRVQVTLELRVPDLEPVRRRRVAEIPLERRPLLTPGAEVPVRYDPDDPGAITLEWELG